MKFKTTGTWYQEQREKGWHKYFALFPVETHNEVVWLAYVERRITGMNNSRHKDTATYEYRLIK